MENQLHVHLHKEWNYKFKLDVWEDKEVFTGRPLICHCCENVLSLIYSYIINSLKEASLLAEGYEPVCCYCIVLEKYGLLELKDALCGFYYYFKEDVLRIEFSHVVCDNIGEGRVVYDVRIHNWSKVKWEK